MIKASLTASLVASATASVTLSQPEGQRLAAKMLKQSHQLTEKLKYPLEHDTVLAAEVKKLSASSSLNLKSRGVTRTRSQKRSLRGKGGKGKGKGKDKDSSSGGGDEDGAARSYLQIQQGYCAGTTIDVTTFENDYFVTSFHYANDICYNIIDEMGEAYSTMNSFYVSETGQLMQNVKYYFLHDCEDMNQIVDIDMPNDDLSFGGMVSPNGMCTTLGDGIGVRVAVSETPVSHTTGGGVMIEGEDNSVNACYWNMMNADYSSFDIIEYMNTDYPTSSGYAPTCHSNDGDDDGDDGDDDDNDDAVPIGGSYMYDLSRCNEDPPILGRSIFNSNTECSGTADTMEFEQADRCIFDKEVEEQVALFQTCWAGA
jgi:hypothetical protein